MIGSVDGSLNVTPEHAGDLKSDTAHLRLSVKGLTLVSDTLASALKQPIEQLDLALALTGPPPWGGTLEDLARWRDAGGTLELRQIAGTWLGLTIDGDGTFALDAQMRPEGALTLRLDGLQGTLQRFADDATLSPQLAELIGERIAELGAPDERVPGRLLIALTAQEGRLTVQDREVGLLSPLTGP